MLAHNIHKQWGAALHLGYDGERHEEFSRAISLPISGRSDVINDEVSGGVYKHREVLRSLKSVYP